MKVKDILTEMNVSHVSVAWVGVMFHRAVLYRIVMEIGTKSKSKGVIVSHNSTI